LPSFHLKSSLKLQNVTKSYILSRKFVLFFTVFSIHLQKIKQMQHKFLNVLSFIAFLLGSGVYAKSQTDQRPNIIVILADDLGYSDLGCYGGEIHTPNLDRLAQDGLRFNSFYNAGKSCPTRASLLTGLYPHEAGVGRMTFDEQLPGYRGNLSRNAVTIAEVLKTAGYRTAMVGKWHVAHTKFEPDQREWLAHRVEKYAFAPIDNYPVHRGFDHHYGIIWGVADYFDPFSLVNGTTPVKEVPEDYYITQAFSDTAAAYVSRLALEAEPFFLYLAYTAPHWPLHALPEDIAKYEDTYTEGWGAVREKRYERIQDKGIFPGHSNMLSPPQMPGQWEDNADRVWDARAMAVHAAMIDRMDQGIGQVIAALKESGEFDNTLILFLSDNGCSAERCQNYSEGENDRPDMLRIGEPMIYPRNKEVLPGPQHVFASVGPHWANVANTPFRFWKGKSFNGGINTPVIAHWPKEIEKSCMGSITEQRAHVMDIMATCIELAGAEYPSEYNGHTIKPLRGKSILPILKGETRDGHEYLGFEHYHEKALICCDGWKIIRQGKEAPWELYDLKNDPTELINVASDYPEKREQMIALYEKWALECEVEPYPGQQ
jgi:arylsulfatase